MPDFDDVSAESAGVTTDVPTDLLDDPDLTYAPGRSSLLAELDRRRRESRRADGSSREDEISSASGSGFLLLEPLDRGGYGDVWSAVQESLRREVAVKKIRRDRWISADPEACEELLDMFRTEALITAQLDHPNIVPVYELGHDAAGRPLLAMKRVRGEPWIDLLREEFELPVDEYLRRHLRTLVDVAQAVAYAHSKGIVHRDLKPHQVMVGKFGEVLLMDWGLAFYLHGHAPSMVKGEDSSTDLGSEVLAAAGTPSFMAPEQARGDVETIGVATDLYLLGGTLYSILTGKSPHRGETAVATFVAAARGVVVPPEERAPDRRIPEDLAELAMGLMHPDPDARVPRSAAEVADALEDYLTGAGRRRRSAKITREIAAHDLAEAKYGELARHLESLREALALWPENEDAERLRRDVLTRYARRALDHGDLALARSLAQRLPDAGEASDEDGDERGVLVHEIERERERRESMARQRRQAREAARRARAEAEELVAFMLEELWERLVEIERTDLMEPVARRAAEYYAARDVSELTFEERIHHADSLMTVGTALSYQGHLGDAARALRKAADGYQDLVGEAMDEDAPEYAVELLLRRVRTLNRLGGSLFGAGRHEAGLEVLREATEASDRGLELAPDHAELLWARAKLFENLGIVHFQRGHLDETREALETAIELAVAAVGPEDAPGRRVDVAKMSTVLASALLAGGRPEEALERVKAAWAILGEDARQPEILRDHGVFLVTIESEILRALDRHRDALETLRPWRGWVHTHAESDPGNRRRRYVLSRLELEIGRAEDGMGRREEAREAWRRAAEAGKPLEEMAESPFLADNTVRALVHLGRIDEARPVARRLLAQGWKFQDFDAFAAEHGLDAESNDAESNGDADSGEEPDQPGSS